MKLYWLIFLVFISGCGSPLTLEQRYNNSISELESYTSQPANKSRLGFKGYSAVLSYLKLNGPSALKDVHVVYYDLGDVIITDPKEISAPYYSLDVFWVGEKLQIKGIQITDQKNGDVYNIRLPDYIANDFKDAEGLFEKEKKFVDYAAIFQIDEKTHQSLRKELDDGDKLELKAMN